MCFDMTNIWYKGFSADRCGSSPTALIKIRKIENFTLGTQNGYENTRQSKLVQKNIIICQFQQPVFRKLVISVNFYLQSSWNYDVILKIYFSGFSNIFYNYIYYHHTKFRIDIICLKKVTGGSFSWNTALALLLFVSEYLGLNKCKRSVCVSQVGKNHSEIVWITFSDLRTRLDRKKNKNSWAPQEIST